MKLKKAWFTLVELIVVITILAIIWTIAFISLQWYSSDARNTKRESDLASLSSAITTSLTEGKNIMSFSKNDNNNDSRVSPIGIWGVVPTYGLEYEAGHISYGALWLKQSDFSDPSYNTPYIIWTTSKAWGRYEIAASMENLATRTAKVVGNYVPRTGIAINGNAFTGSRLFVITNTRDFNKFRLWDTVSWGKSIINISPTGLTLTLDSTYVATQSSISLNATESSGLIDRWEIPFAPGNHIVVDWGTINLPDVPTIQ